MDLELGLILYSLGNTVSVVADTFPFVGFIKMQIRTLHTVILHENSGLDIMKVINSLWNYLYFYCPGSFIYLFPKRLQAPFNWFPGLVFFLQVSKTKKLSEFLDLLEKLSIPIFLFSPKYRR